MTANAYPKPGQIGGTLIRSVVSFMRSQGEELPLKVDRVWLAVSGGADSTALAHLLCTYGRRVIEKEKNRNSSF